MVIAPPAEQLFINYYEISIVKIKAGALLDIAPYAEHVSENKMGRLSSISGAVNEYYW